MSQASSNKREVVAIHKALEEFSPIITKNHWNIQILTDNTTACYNINRKAASINLYHSLCGLFNLTDVMGISIAAAHIQGIFNTEMDKLNLLTMSGDYSLKQYFYLHGLRNLKVIPKLDFFTYEENMKCTKFCTLHQLQKVGTEFMGNAMHLICPSNRVLLIHPPIPLILKVLRKFEREGRVAVVVVPDWKCQIWTPLLKRLAVQKLVLGDTEVVLEKGPDMKKKELSLPPGNIAMYLLKNPARKTHNLCCVT
jgi:hypothetical protein